MIRLENDRLKLNVDPERGAAIWAIHARIRNQWQPVCTGDRDGQSIGDPMASALFVMVPFANRVRNNTIVDGDRRWPVTANTNEPLALHGTGWERPWQVLSHSPDACRLRLGVSDGYPLHFDADYVVALDGNSARFQLMLTNRLFEDLPAGMGFHPYFLLEQDTELQFEADGYWKEGPDYLPTRHQALSEDEGYAVSRRVPVAWQNTCYSGWDRRARITQPGLGYRLEVNASNDLGYLMVFSSPDLDRFAIEPQSHLSGRTQLTQGGLRRLPPNRSWTQEMTFTVNEIEAGGL